MSRLNKRQEEGLVQYRFSELQGVFVAMVTPFTEDRSTIDIQVADRLIRFLAEKGVNGILLLGTTGEGLLLEREERKEIAAKVLKLVPREMPVVVQTGTIATKSTVKLSLHAKEIGAAAIAVVAPYYYSVNQQALFRHYSTVLSEVGDLPMIVYDIPQYAINRVEPTTLSKLAVDHGNLVGIKSSSPDLSNIYGFLEVGTAHNLSVLVGNDNLDFSVLVSGAAGLVSGLANAFPEVYVSLYNAIKENDYELALNCQRAINELVSIFDNESQLASIKGALDIRDVTIGNRVRSPLHPLTNNLKAGLHLQVEKFLKIMGKKEVIDAFKITE